jgi:6-phosphogluconolactonase
MMPTDTRVYQTLALAALAAANQIAELSEQAIGARGRFSIALSGGSTPRVLYELLTTSEFINRVDYPNWHVFWGDERCVPRHDEQSNYHLAHKAFLQHVPIPTSQVYHMNGEIEPEQAAQDYENLLRDWFTRRGERSPRFDLVLLGLGTDGHTASLFPDTPALVEDQRWVVANWVAQLDAWRLTLTARAINSAARVYFLVAGGEKAEAVWRALTPPDTVPEAPPLPGMQLAAQPLPVHLIRPSQGDVRWYLDQHAARLVTTSSLEYLAERRSEQMQIKRLDDTAK